MRGYDPRPIGQPDNIGKHKFFLMAQQIRNMVEFDESECNRRHHRTTRSISISIEPLDDDFQPCGDLFWVVSRDISPKGMGLICNEPINCKFVRTGLLDEPVTVISQVRHNTSIGETYPLFLVGLEFLNGMELA